MGKGLTGSEKDEETLCFECGALAKMKYVGGPKQLVRITCKKCGKTTYAGYAV